MPAVRVRVGALAVAGIAAMTVPVSAAVRDGDGGANALRGSSKADYLNGRGGDDVLRGGRGADHLRGGAGHDVLRGGKGSDRIRAGRGADLIVGGKGADIIVGGRKRDQINMRDGVQLPSPGRDVIHVVDGERDEINCGAGRDKVFVDRVEDGVYDCEKVIEVK